MSDRTLLLVVVAGAGLGLAARLVDGFAPRWVGDAAAVWVLVAFWAGRRSTKPATGAILGAICLVSACLSYYMWRVWVDDDIWPGFLMTVGVFWLFASVIAGGAAGYFGARSLTMVQLWGLVSGAFGGEALAIFFLRGRLLQIVGELLIAGAFLLPGRRKARATLAFAGVVAIALMVVGTGYRLALEALKSARSVPAAYWSLESE